MLRPSKAEMDALQELGNPGWDWESMLHYMKKVCSLTNNIFCVCMTPHIREKPFRTQSCQKPRQIATLPNRALHSMALTVRFDPLWKDRSYLGTLRSYQEVISYGALRNAWSII